MDHVIDVQIEELESMETLWNWTQFGTGFGAGATIISIGTAVGVALT
ncbi:daptide-type RiPP [Streptomyces sp. NPDC007991]